LQFSEGKRRELEKKVRKTTTEGGRGGGAGPFKQTKKGEMKHTEVGGLCGGERDKNKGERR